LGPMWARWILVGTWIVVLWASVTVQARLDYEARFFVYSAVVGVVAALAGWLVLGSRDPIWWRAALNLLGLATCTIACACLLAGDHARRQLHASLAFGAICALPTWIVSLGFFSARGWWEWRSLTSDSNASLRSGPVGRRTITMRELCLLVAGSAYCAWLFRRLAFETKGGWGLELAGEFLMLFGLHGLEMACLVAPFGLVVWRTPRRWWIWLLYAVLFCATSPLFEPLLQHYFVRRTGPWQWPESYGELVVENMTWYGPQMLPSWWLFGWLRWGERRGEEAETMGSGLAET